MKIYADMLFAINFSMDFIALFITNALLQRKIQKKRILISSAIGGLWGVLEVISKFSVFLSTAVTILISLLMCIIAFNDKNMKRFTAMYIIYIGINACLGGFMSVLYSFFNKILAEYVYDYSYNTVYTGARFFVVSSLAIIASILFSKLFKKEKNVENVEVEITFNEKTFKYKALCDSGNFLTEPISGKSVILVSEGTELAKEILNTSDIYKRYIPYNSVGGNGIIKGIVPKQILINDIQRVAIIASISQKSFAGYDACVPKSLVS